MAFKAYGTKGYNTGHQEVTASNSLDINQGDLVTITGGFVVKSGAGDLIDGVSVTDATFAADNQTVGQLGVNFTPIDPQETFRATADADLTAANVGQFFDIDGATNQLVDAATASDTTGQVKLIKFETARVGIYSIVNL
tara:strand:- start:497 stop:913 length:417 start_codon:yes stop_codon:yes gene_type:complete